MSLLLFLLLFSSAVSIYAMLTYLLIGLVFGVPASAISFGSGPQLFRVAVGRTNCQICLFPISTTAQFEHGRPALPQRALTMLAGPLSLLAASWLLSGQMPLTGLGNSFSQLASVIWPFGDSGATLIHQFDLLLGQNLYLAITVLTAKAGLVTLVHALSSVAPWFGFGATPPKGVSALAMVSVLLWLLSVFGVVANLVRHLI